MSKRNKQNNLNYNNAVDNNQIIGSEYKDISNNNEIIEREKHLSKQEEFIKIRLQELRTLEESIIKKEANLNEKQLYLEELELQAKNGFPKLFEEKFTVIKKQLDDRETNCMNEWKSIEAEKEVLKERELTIKKMEIQRDNGFAEERAKHEEKLIDLTLKQEKELELKRKNRLSEIEEEVLRERSLKLTDLEKEVDEKKRLLNKEIEEFQIKRNELVKTKAELDELREEIEYKNQRLQLRKATFEERENNLTITLESKIEERKQSYEFEKASLKEEVDRLRETIRTSNDLISNFEDLKRKLGEDDPAAVLLKLKTYEEEIRELRDELVNRPTQEMQQLFDRIKLEKEELQRDYNRLSEEINQLRSSARLQSDLEFQILDLSDKNKSLLRRYESVDADNNRLMEELRRLQSSYEREADYEARVRDIEKPYIKKQLTRNNETIEEIQWLDSISSACSDYGLKFPRRILHAFHTALKTSEWSPMTVLAGVSGTGKSELPRLYSHFGGINFLNLSVQPNWDSQESMLGFFNSIDNKFDAQPVLKFLAQSQKAKTDEYPFGLEDVMNLVLLDEMNLAHVELYFAEFLSKLELRRGRKGNVPSLEVKLGAGIDHYDLPLGRNVLWAGTMNQDETTKSLSDKVLDRGIVINFPRPTILQRRKELKPLGEHSPLLSRKIWESWWCKESTFTEEQILPFKAFIEEMNNHLSKVGKALGHRVWQSIEYYMCNYPDVMEAQRNSDDVLLAKAMRVAFEDQLVQKVMPKLRGIETRGKSRSDCLDKIRTQLKNDDYTIIDDFDLACEFGYGQFIWNSANYLKDQDFDIETESESTEFINNPDKVELNKHDSIPDELINYAKQNSKEIWMLTTKEIMDVLSCDIKIAKKLKELVNEIKN